MSNIKKSEIALIGTGLMGRTHSNAYNRLNVSSPDYEYRPVLKVACSGMKKGKALLKTGVTNPTKQIGKGH